MWWYEAQNMVAASKRFFHYIKPFNMNDLEFLEMLIRTYTHKDREAISFKLIDETTAESESDIGKIKMRLNNCDYIFPDIKSALQCVKEDYSRFWMRHVHEQNEKLSAAKEES